MAQTTGTKLQALMGGMGDLDFLRGPFFVDRTGHYSNRKELMNRLLSLGIEIEGIDMGRPHNREMLVIERCDLPDFQPLRGGND